jgi:hypothetical protein
LVEQLGGQQFLVFPSYPWSFRRQAQVKACFLPQAVHPFVVVRLALLVAKKVENHPKAPGHEPLTSTPKQFDKYFVSFLWAKAFLAPVITLASNAQNATDLADAAASLLTDLIDHFFTVSWAANFFANS